MNREGLSTADAAISAAARAKFSGAGEVCMVNNGAWIVRQGDPIDRLFLVTRGRVLRYRSFDGEDVPVDDLGRGGLIGLEGVCGTKRHGLGVQALGVVTVSALPAEVFLNMLETDPEAGLLAFSLLSSRLRHCIGATEDLKFRDATVRVARYLRTLSEAQEATSVLTLPVAKKTLAKHLGVTQQSLSRVLRRLREHGIQVRGRQVVVNDPQELHLLADMDVVADTAAG